MKVRALTREFARVGELVTDQRLQGCKLVDMLVYEVSPLVHQAPTLLEHTHIARSIVVQRHCMAIYGRNLFCLFIL